MPPSDVRALAKLAGRQDGVVTRAQLLRLGFTEDEVDNAVEDEWLCVGVPRRLRLGRPLSDRGRVRASTLATGPYSAASFSSATALHRLTPTLPAVLHVSLTRGDRRNRQDLIVHHGLEPEDITYVHGIPVTTPVRTLEDMGWPDRLVREALARGLCSPEQLPLGDTTENDFEDRMRALARRPDSRSRSRSTASAPTASTSPGRS